MRQLVRPRRLPLYQELGPANGKGYPEVVQALTGCTAQRRARQRPRRADRLGGGADPALPRGARRAAAVDPGRRHRHDRGSRALGHLRVFCVAAAVMVVLSMLLAGTIAGPLRRLADGAERVRRGIKRARRDPGLHPPPRRDRPSVRRAARHDQRALQPHRGDRELRRRRRARAEEPADLAAQRGRDPAARQDRGKPQARCSTSSSTTCAGSTG